MLHLFSELCCNEEVIIARIKRPPVCLYQILETLICESGGIKFKR
jgi:hypothetical protein